jgi:nitroreductase
MEEVLKIIQERKSSRCPFDSTRPVAKDDILKLLEAARWSPTAHNMQNIEIIVVDDRKLLESIGKLKNPISRTFIMENYKQLSFSKDELLRKKVGIMGTNFPSSWISPEAKLTGTTGERTIPTLGRFVQTGPVLLVMVYDPSKRAPASEGDFLGVMSLGCVMENIWLMAQSLGIGVHIISNISNEPVQENVKRILNIPGHLKIAITLRLGYPVPGPAKYLRVRRDVKDFTHHNRYGNNDIG